MPRKLRIEYRGAIYHVASHGDENKPIYRDAVDRRTFLRMLGDACLKTGMEVHAYCLLRDHFHLVVETPNANLVGSMQWLGSTYSAFFNRRHGLAGPVVSGRYKSIPISGKERGYVKAACDFVHLNPVRAKLLRNKQPLRDYPWSSFGLYLSARPLRPKWLRVDRLLEEYGIARDAAAGRGAFERQMEALRRSPTEPALWKGLRRGWLFGGPAFRAQMVERLKQTKDVRSGAARRRSAEAKAARIVAEELRRIGWTSRDLKNNLKQHPLKMAIAAKLRRETTVTLPWIARRLKMGAWEGVNTRLHEWTRQHKR